MGFLVRILGVLMGARGPNSGGPFMGELLGARGQKVGSLLGVRVQKGYLTRGIVWNQRNGVFLSREHDWGGGGGLILGGCIGGQKLGSIIRGNIGGQVPLPGGITGGQGLKLGPLIGALLGEGGQGGRKSESIQGGIIWGHG